MLTLGLWGLVGLAKVETRRGYPSFSPKADCGIIAAEYMLVSCVGDFAVLNYYLNA